MATCDYVKIRFRVAAGRSAGPAPSGLTASARFYRRDQTLPLPWRNGFLIGLVADMGTGAIQVEITPHGEAPRMVALDPGIIYLGVIVPHAGGFRTVRAHRLDVRPIVGDRDAAARIIMQEWQSLGGGDTPVLFWNMVEPSTRDEIASMSLARGIRVRMLMPSGEQELVPAQADCQWGSGGGGSPQPAPPPVNPPMGADIQAAPSGRRGGTLVLAGGLLALAIVGVWAWGSK